MRGQGLAPGCQGPETCLRLPGQRVVCVTHTWVFQAQKHIPSILIQSVSSLRLSQCVPMLITVSEQPCRPRCDPGGCLRREQIRREVPEKARLCRVIPERPRRGGDTDGLGEFTAGAISSAAPEGSKLALRSPVIVAVHDFEAIERIKE